MQLESMKQAVIHARLANLSLVNGMEYKKYNSQMSRRYEEEFCRLGEREEEKVNKRIFAKRSVWLQEDI